ncbi:Protein K07F5.15 b [Aphelenchoides avenae]|nr:Protein K07F5.15 b [Aphelenchus avenae]
MPQHKMKQKTSLPKGVKQKVKKVKKTNGAKKGANMQLAPKKPQAVREAKISAEVSRIINEKNEEMVRTRADRDVGKISKGGSAGTSK